MKCKYDRMRGSFIIITAFSINITNAQEHTQWIQPDTLLEVKLDNQSTHTSPSFFIGKVDVTSLFYKTSGGYYVYQANVLPLPQGENELTVYISDRNGESHEIKRQTINVLSESGYKVNEISLSGNISADTQIDEGHSGDAPIPERSQYLDGSLQATLNTRHQRGDTEITSTTNIIGNTHQQNALRFDEKQNAASKVDLSDYIVDINTGNSYLSQGHINYGSHPLLVQDMANRGVKLGHKFGQQLDISASLQNGTTITGADNILGYNNLDHAIMAVSVGYDVIPQEPDRMRVEVSYADAKQLSETNFGIGSVADAQRSKGWGLRLLGNEIEGRLRYDLSFARNTFVNPEDPLLSQGLDTVEVEADTANAWRIEGTYDIVQADYSLATPFQLSATIRHELTEPLYRSLTAFPSADLLINHFGLQGSYGAVAFTAAYQTQEDNLDDISTILKTQTDSGHLTLDASLEEFISISPSQAYWLPSISVAATHVHQYTKNNPVNDDSDFNGGSHLPDQISKNVNFSMNWNFNQIGFSYQYDYASIDNRQIGRESADFLTHSNGLSVSYQPLDAIDMNIGWFRNTNIDDEQAITSYSTTWNGGVNWRISPRFIASANASFNDNDDSIGQIESKNWSGDAGVNYRFHLLHAGQKLPAQVYLRYIRQHDQNKDNLFDLNSTANSWALTGGINVEF